MSVADWKFVEILEKVYSFRQKAQNFNQGGERSENREIFNIIIVENLLRSSFLCVYSAGFQCSELKICGDTQKNTCSSTKNKKSPFSGWTTEKPRNIRYSYDSPKNSVFLFSYVNSASIESPNLKIRGDTPKSIHFPKKKKIFFSIGWTTKKPLNFVENLIFHGRKRLGRERNFFFCNFRQFPKKTYL